MKTLTTPVIGCYDTPVIPCYDTESIAPSFRTTTLPSLGATTRNPFVKLFSRLFAVFGLVMMLGVTNANSADLCYDPPVTTGFLCLGFFDVGCTTTTTIRNISSSTITDTTIIHAFQGFEFDMRNKIGIDEDEKTVNQDGDEAELSGTLNSYTNLNGFMDMNIFGKGIVYRTGSYAPFNPSSIADQHEIYIYNLISMAFEADRYLAEYTKDGVTYSAAIPPCSGTPYITITDANVTEGNSGTKTMSFTVTLTNPPAGAGASDKTDLSFTTTGITATGGTDYVSLTNFTANNLVVGNFPYTVNVTINGDATIENNETFNIDMTIGENDLNAVLIDSRGMGTIIDDDSGGSGVTPPISSAYANVDVVNGYSGSGGTYQSWITTKVSAKPGVTLNAVYLGDDSANPVPQPYTPSGNVQQAASITVLYKLADMSGGATCTNAPTADLYQTDVNGNIVYSGGKPVPAAAIIGPGVTSATSTTFTMQYLPVGLTAPLVKRDVRIKYKAVDFNQLINDSNITCAQRSSTGGVVEGIPACLIGQDNDSAVIDRYKTIFGQTAYENCYTANGQPCLSSNGGVGAAPYDTIYGCFECSIGNMPYVCSKDNFAIRPNYFDINSTQTAFPNLLRSAEDYNLSVYAYDYGVTSGTNGSDDYNITGATSLFDLNTTKYMKNSEINASMNGTAVWSAYDFNMSDGVSWASGAVGSEVAGVQFNDVGKISLRVVDANWSEVDIDDTLQDCSANGAYICGDKNVTYIPYYFDFHDLNITNNNGNPGSFTYIANEVGQMAGRIHTEMRALNKSGNETRNFATYPLWENNVTVTPVVVKSTYLYPDANETNITNLTIGFSDGNKTVTWNETNTSQYLRFNFRRDVNQTANPFDVNGTDLNISMVSHYVDAEDGDTADINGSRLGTGIANLPYTVLSPADGNTTMVYGRIIPRDVRVFGNVDFVANAWYEVYNASTLGGASLRASRNEAMWYVNSLHNDAIDGDGNVTVIIPTTPLALPTHSSSTVGMETYQFSAILLANIPYGGKAHINTDPWLWYGVNALGYADPGMNVDGTTDGTVDANDCIHHPCFNITVVPPMGATGSAKSTNETTKGSKKSDSGGGAWKSTSDYAPAIR